MRKSSFKFGQQWHTILFDYDMSPPIKTGKWQFTVERRNKITKKMTYPKKMKLNTHKNTKSQ